MLSNDIALNVGTLFYDMFGDSGRTNENQIDCLINCKKTSAGFCTSPSNSHSVV